MSAREFTLNWTLDAPPAEVFRAWTDPERLEWYYNEAFPIPDEAIELDLRVGGTWRQRMIVDEDTAYTTGGVYREIVPNEKLVFAWGAVGGWPELDPERLDESPSVSVTFRDRGEQTDLTVHVTLPEGIEERIPPAWFAHIENGWRETVDRLRRATSSSRLPNGSLA
jgi:uncharacterized protein YndB with AHSA1/START domain